MFPRLFTGRPGWCSVLSLWTCGIVSGLRLNTITNFITYNYGKPRTEQETSITNA